MTRRQGDLAGLRLSASLTVRLGPEERADLDRAAELRGRSISDWARRVLLRAARRGTGAAGVEPVAEG